MGLSLSASMSGPPTARPSSKKLQTVSQVLAGWRPWRIWRSSDLRRCAAQFNPGFSGGCRPELLALCVSQARLGWKALDTQKPLPVLALLR
jgi:hypothetical protein